MFLLQTITNPNVNLQIILPEMIVAVAGIIVMLYDSFFPKQRAVTGTVSLIGLALVGGRAFHDVGRTDDRLERDDRAR